MTCKRGRIVEIHLSDMESAGLNDAVEFFTTIMNKLFATEMDLGYYKMLSDGMCHEEDDSYKERMN